VPEFDCHTWFATHTRCCLGGINRLGTLGLALRWSGLCCGCEHTSSDSDQLPGLKYIDSTNSIVDIVPAALVPLDAGTVVSGPAAAGRSAVAAVRFREREAGLAVDAAADDADAFATADGSVDSAACNATAGATDEDAGGTTEALAAISPLDGSAVALGAATPFEDDVTAAGGGIDASTASPPPTATAAAPAAAAVALVSVRATLFFPRFFALADPDLDSAAADAAAFSRASAASLALCTHNRAIKLCLTNHLP